jgi:hypothetical protein
MGRMAEPQPLRCPDAARGQRWHRPDRGEVRVLAVFDGYVAVRRKGCSPYLVRLRELYMTYGFSGDGRKRP